MKMPFELHNDLPEGYSISNASAEQLAGMNGYRRINAMRLTRNEPPLDQRLFGNAVHRGGVVIVSDVIPGQQSETPVAYLVAGRNFDHRNRGHTLVRDMFVSDQYRGNGIGGAMLGKVITNNTPQSLADETCVTVYDNDLTVAGQTYLLPGEHVTANQLVMSDEAMDRFMELQPAAGWSGIRSIVGGEHDDIHEVYSNGDIVGEIEPFESGFRIAGEENKIYPEIVFAAIALLNEPI